MKLKTLLFGAALASTALTASAQEKGFRFGVTAGMNLSNVTDLKADSKLGFNAGIRGEYNFSKNFYGNIGLLWSMQGCSYATQMQGIELTAKCNPSYLKLPIHVGGRYFVGDNISLFAETGPYVAVGILGKVKASANAGIIDIEQSSDYFDNGEDDPGMKRFDAGWGVRAGIEFSQFQIHLGYDHGFVNISDDTSSKNWNFNVGVSYMF